MSWRRGAGVLAVAALGLAAWLAWPYARSTRFLLAVADVHPTVRRFLPGHDSPVTTTDLTVPTRDGPIAVRLFSPTPATRRTVVVFPGVHGGGVDEPRLVTFSRRLAATGTAVLAAPLPELRAFRITPHSTDEIEDIVGWVAASPRFAPSGRVHVVGISFAGGLALVAAGRPSLRDHIASVISLGGYANLPRVLTYLCTGRLPDGRDRAPEPYALDVLLLDAAGRLVPAREDARFERSVTSYLQSASDAGVDDRQAASDLDQARRDAGALTDRARALFTLVLTRDAATLGRQLLPMVETLGGAPALSPDQSPVTRAPVFLLQGEDDNVIPPTELAALASYLRRQGNTQVTALLTPVISHVTLQPGVPVADAWRLVRFWADVLSTPP